ncbi:MAG: Rpn family recombination-promoting nuclease/putative transposase [Oscillatoria sp. PMC 1068.18]|nr:Rpn family recombination-promoting nuclease/putative transposase [Oscillatoria sp. PMC 1068.18]
MRFISPKTDFAFKKIFGSDQSKDILISFLNAIIYSGNLVIEDLEIIDPANAGDVVELKDTYLDVKAVLQDRTTVIIEMQVWNVEAFEKRIIYNLCKTYGNQLKSGQGYFDLNPVIALTITDFNLFTATEKVINRFYFQEEAEHFSYQENELKMVFVELPKFHKKLEDLENVADKWIYFIKEAPSLEIIPPKMSEVPQIEKALNIANQASLSVEELEKLHKQELYIEDRRGAITFAKREGREQGRQEGRQEGKLEGERNLILRQIERRFGKVSSSTKVSIEAFNSEDLERLGEAMWDFDTSDDLATWLEENSP